ncbi:hypothetical protein ACWEOZ_32160 [Actinoplanes sp. NPDC004185]
MIVHFWSCRHRADVHTLGAPHPHKESCWFSVSSQEQTLDGHTVKRLSVGKASIVLARMRVKAPQTTDLTYDVHPGDVAIQTPELQFRGSGHD